jgi:cytochrome c oxidase subunit 1
MPTIVGGPYEYGVPGAVHAIFREGARIPTPAGHHTTPTHQE